MEKNVDDKIDLINDAFTKIYNFGWRVGRMWDSNWRKNNCDPNGCFNNEHAILTELTNSIKKLLSALDINPDSVHIYDKIDLSGHCDDWDYTAPSLELKETSK